jgi:hypothetical protein
MANQVVMASLWVVLLLAVVAAGRFVFTALSAPEKAWEHDVYHQDFLRLRIVYYFAVWAGTGAIVFFGSHAVLSFVLQSVGLSFLAVWGHVCDAMAIGLAFSSILFIHQLSVVREFVTVQNKRSREAETFRDNVQKLVEELDFMDGAAAHEIRAFFYNCKVDIEMAGSGLTSPDRDLLRGVLGLARRGIPEMQGVERPGLQ